MAKKKSFESKLKNNNLAEAFTNIAKGFEYLGEDNAQLLNKIKMNEDINADEIDVVLLIRVNKKYEEDDWGWDK